VKPPAPPTSPTEALSTFVSASGTFAPGFWLLLPMAIGAMWWPSIGGVAVVVLALSCWFRWFGIRELKKGFALGGIEEFAWLRVWQAVNAVTAGGGLAIALGVVSSSTAAFPAEGRGVLLGMENIWLVLLVGELLVTTRLVAAVAAWLESTWVRVTQAIVACLLALSLCLHVATQWMPPATAADSTAAVLARASAIIIAAATGLLSIWWIADGVNRMALALADEMVEEPPATL
jgi:hypothetical protein